MKLTTKCRYGSRAILEIARSHSRVPVKRKDIAKTQKLSPSYLENILISLKNSGIIDARRGANGGYVLTRDPSEISLLDVILALEGTMAPVECLENDSACERIGRCSTRKIWKKMQEARENVLRSVSVSDLLKMEEKDNTLD